MTDRDMMLMHGTTLLRLKPQNIVQAAAEDLRRFERNKGQAKSGRIIEQYAFHRDHVRKSKTARGIIAMALAEPGIGAVSHKPMTRFIYDDIFLLADALAMLPPDEVEPKKDQENG